MDKDSDTLKRFQEEEVEKHGLDIVNKRDMIIKEAHSGAAIIDSYNNGESSLGDKKEDHSFLTTSLLQVLHFQRYVWLVEQMIQEWGSDGFPRSSQLSEGMYMKYANGSKYFHDLYESSGFTDVLAILLTLKSENDADKAKHILDICNNTISNMWKEAKLTKQSQT